MKSIITVTLQIEIDDETTFRQTAHAQALRENDPEVAKPFLDPEQTDLAQCAQMIFDPAIGSLLRRGMGPDGCSILGSAAEDDTAVLSGFSKDRV